MAISPPPLKSCSKMAAWFPCRATLSPRPSLVLLTETEQPFRSSGGRLGPNPFLRPGAGTPLVRTTRSLREGQTCRHPQACTQCDEHRSTCQTFDLSDGPVDSCELMEGAAPDPEGQSANRNQQPRQSIDDGLNHSVLEQNHGFLDDTRGSGRLVDHSAVTFVATGGGFCCTNRNFPIAVTQTWTAKRCSRQDESSVRRLVGSNATVLIGTSPTKRNSAPSRSVQSPPSTDCEIASGT